MGLCACVCSGGKKKKNQRQAETQRIQQRCPKQGVFWCPKWTENQTSERVHQVELSRTIQCSEWTRAHPIALRVAEWHRQINIGIPFHSSTASTARCKTFPEYICCVMCVSGLRALRTCSMQRSLLWSAVGSCLCSLALWKTPTSTPRTFPLFCFFFLWWFLLCFFFCPVNCAVSTSKKIDGPIFLRF